MKITSDNIFAHELIGLYSYVKECRDPTITSLRGLVVDETKKTLKLKVDDRVKTVAKDIARFVFSLPDGLQVSVEGRELVGRPHERVARLRWRR